MKIFVTAKPNAREDKIEKTDPSARSRQDHFIVSVTEPPVQGKANRAIIKLLAAYFGVSQLQIKIVSGFTSKNKTIIIEI